MAFLNSSAGTTVFNKGIGGQNSSEGRDRFLADVVGLRPEYALIYFGINDTLNEHKFVSLENYIANMEWMLLQCKESCITPVLCTLHPVKEAPLFQRHAPEWYGEEGPNAKIDRYNESLRKLANKHSIPIADFAAAARREGIDRVVSDDGVHLTKEGNRLLAETFLDALNGGIQSNEAVVCIGDSITNGSGLKEAGTATGGTYPGMLAALIARRRA